MTNGDVINDFLEGKVSSGKEGRNSIVVHNKVLYCHQYSTGRAMAVIYNGYLLTEKAFIGGHVFSPRQWQLISAYRERYPINNDVFMWWFDDANIIECDVVKVASCFKMEGDKQILAAPDSLIEILKSDKAHWEKKALRARKDYSKARAASGVKRINQFFNAIEKDTMGNKMAAEILAALDVKRKRLNK